MTDTTSDEALVMAARQLAPDVRAARIAELEAELARLRLPSFIEYPKMLPDGRVVASAEDEAQATAPAKDVEPAKEPEPEPEAGRARTKASGR